VTVESMAGEFDQQASVIASRLHELPAVEQIAAACRGSGNPAALSWLAECLGLHHRSWVIDLGAGIGGPAAWLTRRYGCQIVNLEPAPLAARAANRLFGAPTICGAAERAPVKDDAFDVGLLLGVLSVVENPGQVLREARRIASGIGVMEYCSTSPQDVVVGGSTFVPAEGLRCLIEQFGWRVVQEADVDVPSPRSWAEATAKLEIEQEDSEIEVVHAIEAGRLAPVVMHAAR